MNNLITVFNEMGYEIKEFPATVKNKKQNISVKFSPVDIDLELITNFSSSKSFEQAYLNSEKVTIQGVNLLSWNVLSYEDLIDSKLKAQRPKDLLDIQQLQQIKGED